MQNKTAAVLQSRITGKVRFVMLLVAIIVIASSVTARADVSIADLSVEGWERDTSLLGVNVDRYNTTSGSLTLELLAFPATQLSAGEWLDEIIVPMTKEDVDAGVEVVSSPLDVPNLDKADNDADIASRLVFAARRTKNQENLLITVGSVVRQGQPVQLSILTQHHSKPTDTEKYQASRISNSANLPFNESAASFLGRDGLVQVMTSPLLYLDDKRESRKSAKVVQPVKKRSVVAKTRDTKKTNELSELFEPFPGPQVPLTGKTLDSLPGGYRMQIRATNYWVSDDMQSTRQKHFTLTSDGQFEFGSFSVMGGMGGVVGSIHSSGKKGSVGSVFGDTFPGGPGAKSVALIEKKGLDGSKYGTYYISGDEIELAFANGEIKKFSFQTNGYNQLLLSGKRYFAGTPDGWERRGQGKKTYYRTFDKKYTGTVRYLGGDIDSGRKWLERFVALGLKKKNFLSAGPITSYRKPDQVSKSTLVFKNKSGTGTIAKDIYVVVNSSSGYSFILERTTDKEDINMLLKFVSDL